MDGIVEWLKRTKGLLAGIVASVGVLVFVSGRITDYARMPDRIKNIEAMVKLNGERMDTIANMTRDLILQRCIEHAEEDNESAMKCIDAWRDTEVHE